MFGRFVSSRNTPTCRSIHGTLPTHADEAGSSWGRVMFKIKYKESVTIYGCPSSGVEAVDFRRGLGIPEASDNKFLLEIDVDSEQVCRRFAEALDGDADLQLCRLEKRYHITRNNDGCPMICETNRGYGYGSNRVTVGAGALAEYIANPSIDKLTGLLVSIIQVNNAEYAKVSEECNTLRAEREEKEALQRRKSEARLLLQEELNAKDERIDELKDEIEELESQIKKLTSDSDDEDA